MEFEWDDDKREANLAKHGVDFLDARTIWTRPVLDPADLRLVDGELRPTALGMIEGEIIVAVVYTLRGDVMRIISARRARRNERKIYHDRFGRGV